MENCPTMTNFYGWYSWWNAKVVEVKYFQCFPWLSFTIMTNNFLTDLIHHLYTNQQSIFAVYSRNLLLIGFKVTDFCNRDSSQWNTFLIVWSYWRVCKQSKTQDVMCFRRNYLYKKLPLCFDRLKLHIKQPNYQAALQRFLECNSTIQHSFGHGSSENKSSIKIVWNECSPAPNEVPYLLLCGCSRKYKIGTYSC